MVFLLTNDDGIEAPGLAALLEAARPFGDVTVVAPVHAHSGCSHRLTTDTPIRLDGRGPGRHAVEGTPADCVRIGLHAIVPEAEWILSGINAGGNLGVDVFLSGTVAAAREAALHGKQAIAFSYYHPRGHVFQWGRAAQWVGRLLPDLLRQPLSPGSFWNVNLPGIEGDPRLPEVVHCPVDPTPLPLRYRAEGDVFHYDTDYHARTRLAGSDVDVCFNGRVAISRITLASV